jgi:energy-coupling factor transporter transmembrane protein EcfT
MKQKICEQIIEPKDNLTKKKKSLNVDQLTYWMGLAATLVIVAYMIRFGFNCQLIFIFMVWFLFSLLVNRLIKISWKLSIVIFALILLSNLLLLFKVIPGL